MSSFPRAAASHGFFEQDVGGRPTARRSDRTSSGAAAYPPTRELAPERARRLRPGPRAPAGRGSCVSVDAHGRKIRSSWIREDFARRVALDERFQIMESHRTSARLTNGRLERAREIDQPYLVAGRERYGRVAAAVGIEPRDPFLDLRVRRRSACSFPTTRCSRAAGRRRFSDMRPSTCSQTACAGGRARSTSAGRSRAP